jgi:hypothetical protein
VEIVIAQIIAYLNKEIYLSVEGFDIVIFGYQFLFEDGLSFLEMKESDFK